MADEEEKLIERVKERVQERLGQPPPQDRERIVAAMRANNADPAYIHAYEKTGILPFQETMHLIDPEDMQRWADAYEEYGRKTP